MAVIKLPLNNNNLTKDKIMKNQNQPEIEQNFETKKLANDVMP